MAKFKKNEEDIVTGDVWDSKEDLIDAISTARRAANETLKSDMYIADDFDVILHTIKFNSN